MRPKASPKRRKAAAKPTAPPRRRRTLLPVMRPAQNMREIIKQMVLLEDHVLQSCKRCGDCTNKHMIMIEGLAEECASLCAAKNADVSKDADRVGSEIRVLHHAFAESKKAPASHARVCADIAARIRALRKPLMAKYATLPIDTLPTNETAAVKKLLGRKPRPGTRRK